MKKNLQILTLCLILICLAAIPSFGETTSSNENEDNGKSGVQLWADNCARCHNLIPPTTYGSREWETVTHHMRVRANLTAEEYEKIKKFLKSSK